MDLNYEKCSPEPIAQASIFCVIGNSKKTKNEVPVIGTINWDLFIKLYSIYFVYRGRYYHQTDLNIFAAQVLKLM